MMWTPASIRTTVSIMDNRAILGGRRLVCIGLSSLWPCRLDTLGRGGHGIPEYKDFVIIQASKYNICIGAKFM